MKKIFILIITAAIVSCSQLSTDPEVKVENNVIIKSNFNFNYEQWIEPQLKQLYDNENFKDIKAKTQFDLFLKLCDWTAKQWEHSKPEPIYPLCNAINILKLIREKKTGGFCGQYAYVLADVLKSMGFFNVRYVELYGKDNQSHFVNEVWSDEFKKWFILDAYENVYYIIKTTKKPANAYEIRNSFYGGGTVEAVKIDKSDTPDSPKLIEYYRHFAVSMMSDLMELSKPLTINNRYAMFLFFKDKNTEKPFKEKIPYKNITGRIEDIYFDCDKVRVEYTIDKNNINFEFFTDNSMPNFRNFMIMADRAKGWKNVPNRVSIKVPYGSSTFWVVAVNQLNRLGVPTKIEVNY